MTWTDAGGRALNASPDGIRETLMQQGRRRPSDAADLVVRQIQAIDAWIATRRERERVMRSQPLTRDGRMDADRHIAALRRTHDVIRGRCAAGLDDKHPFRTGATAVIAHRHAWFAENLAMSLGDSGVNVLASTDDGAEALGAVVAEQPDLLLVGERLAMLAGPALLDEARLFAPHTLRALQPTDQEQADQAPGVADVVYPRHYSPRVVADSLLALHLGRCA